MNEVQMTLFNLLKKNGKPSTQSFYSITTKFQQQCVSVCTTNTMCHSYSVGRSQVNDHLIECHFYDTATSKEELITEDGVQYHIQMKTCEDWYNLGARTSGVYEVNWMGRTMKNVRCNMELDGGGWTVFHRRFVPVMSCEREWDDFKTGFGDVYGQFWLGNDFLHEITTSKRHYVLVYGQHSDGTEVISKYGSFYIENEAELYRLHFNESLLTGIHSLTSTKNEEQNLNGMAFTTIDRDNDKYPTYNCAVKYTGAGWLKRCSQLGFCQKNKLRWNTTITGPALREISLMIKSM